MNDALMHKLKEAFKMNLGKLESIDEQSSCAECSGCSGHESVAERLSGVFQIPAGFCSGLMKVAGVVLVLVLVCMLARSKCFQYYGSALVGLAKPRDLADGGGELVAVSAEDVGRVYKPKKSLLCFLASWCGHCTSSKPEVVKMASSASFPFYHIDEHVIEKSGIGAKFSIDAFPCFVALHDQKEVGRVLGADLARLQALVAELEKR